MAQIYISIGSNIDKEINLIKGLEALKKTFGALTLSSLFESESIGFDGPVFYNMVIGASTHLPLDVLAKKLRDIEYAHGRDFNAIKNSPRTLDLDLLLYDDLVVEQPVQLPRDEITKNAFVLWPLAELAPDEIHPVLKQSYQQLWQGYDKTTQQLRKVPLNWQ
ncbi:2-amino-4-hydroxy-6-hydroxymethyldihydropteridine diphosphokinase [Thalassotalea sp. LPB0316]|uniref:2-amino-4-hydroxy-6- hydroxymethyldihydropteridine diphosphokinase n=1 Tax=Thalassotalea sp. LPB0316 TaxID=2769490 RepID=UPI0018670A62|nr:2-amino-4-hydroxy-6-hydroxymethyldihydropteridine diphosphokinase [Thalassotalea sp. LPB0316]QOL25787.1 2-amino-4-hydroxy-6-hydroxymethyldihydropteridine diphosphokinase [Thalassotalea sp. LPB0316]